MFLIQEQLHQLTGKVHYSAQARVLNAMGFEHKRRPDGSLLVLRTHVERLLGGEAPHNETKTFEPDWSGVNA
jgi:hypothetical protein